MVPDDLLLEPGRPDLPADPGARGLLLKPGARLLHIGPHKTGTTAIQGAFDLARARLAAHGVVYAGAERQPLLAALAVTGQPALLGGLQPDIAHWKKLAHDVGGAAGQRAVVSSEFLAGADDASASRIIEDLGGEHVHVVVTLRPLARILPSQWQQYLQNGYCMAYLEWLDGTLSKLPNTPTPGFWRRHRHDELVSRWATAAGTGKLTVIVVDDSDRLMLLRTFESLLGLPNGFLVFEDGVTNRSLTLAEAEVVRLLNKEFKRQKWPDSSYARFMRYGAIEQMKAARQPSPGEARIVTPAWALERAAEIGAEMARNIRALGVRVVGDLSTLGRAPASSLETGARTGPAARLIPLEAAAQAVLGTLIACGVAGLTADAQQQRAIADRLVCEVTAGSLAAVLVKRGRERARRTLSLRAPG